VTGDPDPAAGRWEHFDHDADIGVRGIGPSLAAAFAQAGRALAEVACEGATVRPLERVAIECEAPDPELLLADWLNAVVFEMSTRKMLFSRFEVTLELPKLHGQVWGEPIDPARHAIAVEPKGATYTALKVAPCDDGGWIAQCVIDV
jgi:SHS2 domain-containing protein